jgi:hypothetical protein
MHFHSPQLPPNTHNSLYNSTAPQKLLTHLTPQDIYISTRGRIHLDLFAPTPVWNDVTNFSIGPAASSSKLGAEIRLLFP